MAKRCHSRAGRRLFAELTQAFDEFFGLLAIRDQLRYKRRSFIEGDCRGTPFRSDFREPFCQPSEHVFKLLARGRVFNTFGFGTGALDCGLEARELGTIERAPFL